MVTLENIKAKTLLLILGMINLFSCCSKDKILKDDELSIKRTDYNGNQLRIDGYYYNKWGNPERATIYFFNKNGILLEGGSPLLNDLSKREEEYSNGVYHHNIKDDKLSWGVYQIEGNTIKFEKWYPSDPPLKSYIRSGVILNDSTFQITKSMRSNGEEIKDRNEIYYFKAFSPKPDSTNTFVH